MVNLNKDVMFRYFEDKIAWGGPKNLDHDQLFIYFD